MRKLFIILFAIALIACDKKHDPYYGRFDNRMIVVDRGSFYKIYKDIETGNEFFVVYSNYGVAVTKID